MAAAATRAPRVQTCCHRCPLQPTHSGGHALRRVVPEAVVVRGTGARARARTPTMYMVTRKVYAAVRSRGTYSRPRATGPQPARTARPSAWAASTSCAGHGQAGQAAAPVWGCPTSNSVGVEWTKVWNGQNKTWNGQGKVWNGQNQV